jgi:serine/threonine-protein kinase HipA
MASFSPSLSLRYGDHVERDLALAYGDVFIPEEITPYALADFAHRTGTPPAQLAREVTLIARSVLRLAPAAMDIYIGDERALVAQIAEYICAQAKQLLTIAREVPKVDPSLFEDVKGAPR